MEKNGGGNQTGATLIEFALVLPVFLLLIVGILTYGIAFATQQVVNYAAQRSAEAVIRVDPAADDYNGIAEGLVNKELASWLGFLPVDPLKALAVKESRQTCSGKPPAGNVRLCLYEDEPDRRVIEVKLAPTFDFPLTGYIPALGPIRATGRSVVAADDDGASF